MLSGAIAAILATVFARIFAEPQVDLAIAFEAAGATAHAMAGHAVEQPELVSRATQKGLGLLTAAVLYGSAMGGIFSLVFAYGYGRLARIGPRSFSLILAVIAFAIVAIVPAVKYPPNPPAVGQHETVALRTAAYFGMIILSLLASMVANRVRMAMELSAGVLTAFLVACAVFVGLVLIGQQGLPTINEVPADFPATVLWNFRLAAIGMQFVLWITLGIVFGSLAEGLLQRQHQHGAIAA